MSLELEQNIAQHDQMLIDKLKDDMTQMKKEMENKSKVNELLLRKIKDISSEKKEIKIFHEKQMKNLTAEKDELIDVLGKQKIIIDELILREPDKVKKLKQQKNSLATKQGDLHAEIKALTLSNGKLKRAMEEKVDEVERLMCELKMARADCNEKACLNVALSEEVSIVQKLLKETKEQETVNKEKVKMAEKQINELQTEISLITFACSTKDSTIIELKKDIEFMKSSHMEKDIELLNLKKKIDALMCQVAFSVVQIATNYAVNTEQLGLEITELRSRCMERGQELESLTLINAEINDEVKLLRQHVEHCETTIILNEKMLKEAENEVSDKLIQLKDMAIANNELLNVNKTLIEEMKLQDQRIVNMEEKMRDIMKFCTIERKRNVDILNEMKLVDIKMKGMEDSMMGDEKKKGKNLFRGLISRFLCNGRLNG